MDACYETDSKTQISFMNKIDDVNIMKTRINYYNKNV